jgi:hypothetical protein
MVTGAPDFSAATRNSFLIRHISASAIQPTFNQKVSDAIPFRTYSFAAGAGYGCSRRKGGRTGPSSERVSTERNRI